MTLPFIVVFWLGAAIAIGCVLISVYAAILAWRVDDLAGKRRWARLRGIYFGAAFVGAGLAFIGATFERLPILALVGAALLAMVAVQTTVLTQAVMKDPDRK